MKKYSFKPYNKQFPELFEKERARIASQLNMPLQIEHVGSTAVPGLPGKGIIDIAIAAKNSDFEEVTRVLIGLGYVLNKSFTTSDWLFFTADREDAEEGTRKYHIHVSSPENPRFIELIKFRDYLKTHEEALLEYAELKKQAASEACNVGERYREIKQPMFDKVRDRL